jgi:2-keto-3-deoxy-L-rhamnonate aldolase RhmA
MPKEEKMRQNAVKKKLKNGEFVFGTMIKEMLTGSIVDLLELAGFDYVVCDMEHARYDMPIITDLLQYARKSAVTGVVRVPELNYANVAKALDMGAEGIWVPHIDTEEEAKLLVQYGKYPPDGKRGAAVPPHRTKELIEAGDPASYFKMCNDEVLLIAQIESGQAIDDIDKIAGVPGIDVCMMGTMDLSLDLGYPGQGGHPEMKKAVQKVVDASKKANIASGTHIPGIEMIRYWMEQGMRMITCSYETNFIVDRGKEVLKLMKEGFVTE